MERKIIRCVRNGKIQWNEDDRLALVNLLVKAGYVAKIGYRAAPGQRTESKTPKMEYTVEYWEDEK